MIRERHHTSNIFNIFNVLKKPDVLVLRHFFCRVKPSTHSPVGQHCCCPPWASWENLNPSNSYPSYNSEFMVEHFFSRASWWFPLIHMKKNMSQDQNRHQLRDDENEECFKKTLNPPPFSQLSGGFILFQKVQRSPLDLFFLWCGCVSSQSNLPAELILDFFGALRMWSTSSNKTSNLVSSKWAIPIRDAAWRDAPHEILDRSCPGIETT